MELSGQLEKQEEEPLVPTEQGWPQGQSGYLGEEEGLLSLPGIETHNMQSTTDTSFTSSGG